MVAFDLEYLYTTAYDNFVEIQLRSMLGFFESIAKKSVIPMPIPKKVPELLAKITKSFAPKLTLANIQSDIDAWLISMDDSNEKHYTDQESERFVQDQLLRAQQSSIDNKSTVENELVELLVDSIDAKKQIEEIENAFANETSNLLMESFNETIAKAIEKCTKFDRNSFLASFQFYKFVVTPQLAQLFKNARTQSWFKLPSWKRIFARRIIERSDKSLHVTSVSVKTDTEFQAEFGLVLNKLVAEVLSSPVFKTFCETQFMNYVQVLKENCGNSGKHVVLENFDTASIATMHESLKKCNQDFCELTSMLYDSNKLVDSEVIGENMYRYGTFLTKFQPVDTNKDCFTTECKFINSPNAIGKQDDMIMCDCCHRWFHMQTCLNLSSKEIELYNNDDTQQYACPNCNEWKQDLPSEPQQEPEPATVPQPTVAPQQTAAPRRNKRKRSASPKQSPSTSSRPKRQRKK